MSSPTLTALYTSGSSPVAIDHPILAPASDQTAYLAALRNSASALQTEINTLLTQKMEDDKAAATGVDENKEEAYYGEEQQGEE